MSRYWALSAAAGGAAALPGCGRCLWQELPGSATGSAGRGERALPGGNGGPGPRGLWGLRHTLPAAAQGRGGPLPAAGPTLLLGRFLPRAGPLPHHRPSLSPTVLPTSHSFRKSKMPRSQPSPSHTRLCLPAFP